MLPLAALPINATPIHAMPLNDDTVSPGFLGFGVFVALAVATVLLVRSMNKRIKKIQAPREADLKQQRWERAQEAREAKEAEAASAGSTEAAGPAKVAAEPAGDKPASGDA